MTVQSRRIVVSGANSGVGFEATRRLLRAGAEVVMVCRNDSRAQQAAQILRSEQPGARLQVQIADMSSLASVRDLAGRLRGTGVGALVNNAGVARWQREITDEGFERTLATNHLGAFLLTLELLDDLLAAGGRVINVSSRGHAEGDLRRAPLDDLLRGRVPYGARQAYCDSKLANVLLALELHRRYAGRGLTAVAVHPGVLATPIWNKLGGFLGRIVAPVVKLRMQPPSLGGEAVSRLLLDAQLRQRSGVYFDVFDEVEASEQARDVALAAALWTASAAAVGATKHGSGSPHGQRGVAGA